MAESRENSKGQTWTNLRREFSRHGRAGSNFSGSMTRQSSRLDRTLSGDGTTEEPTEDTALLANRHTFTGNLSGRQLLTNSLGTPWYEDRAPLVKYPMEFLHLTWKTLASNYVNVLLVFVPVGIILGALHVNATAVFITNFLAIMPLAALLSFATEELSVRVGETLGGLLNATFGNAVELIVSIVALTKDEIRVVQSSMLGSILSNILLVLGCCFIASGVSGRREAEFNSTAASTMSSLMAVAATSLIIPATLYASLSNSKTVDSDDTRRNILILSRGTAVIMLVLYCLYLFFQLRTHPYLFVAKKDEGNGEDAEGQQQNAEDDDENEPQILGPIPATVCLIITTILVAICAEYLVDSIDSIVSTTGISKTFIGLILLPIVGNAAEHVTACVVAYKNKMDLAIGVAIGSSMQIALFVTPFLVILSWFINDDVHALTLNFKGFETVVFFMSVLVVNYLIQDGKSNYLEGCMCLGTYIIIAVAFFVYPDNASDTANMVQRFFGQ